MKFTAWQVITLIGIVIAGAQLPMFALAANIDNDEAAKSALGIVSGGSLAAIAIAVVRLLGRVNATSQEDQVSQDT